MRISGNTDSFHKCKSGTYVVVCLPIFQRERIDVTTLRYIYNELKDECFIFNKSEYMKFKVLKFNENGKSCERVGETPVLRNYFTMRNRISLLTCLTVTS